MHQHQKMIFILTNGNIIQQKNKINSINIPYKSFIKVYYASSKGKKFEKPHPYFMNKILFENDIDYNEILFIGDN